LRLAYPQGYNRARVNRPSPVPVARMASQSRQKTFHYKRAQFVMVDEQPLSGLILAAHKKEKRPMKRAQRFGVDGENYRLVNQCYAVGSMVVGCLLDFTVGNFQPIVNIDEEGLVLAISQLEPGAKQQILEGMLFFGIEDCHVVLVQSNALRAWDFEKYLNWWLVERTSILPDGALISLDNEPSRAAKEKLSGVRSVKLKAPAILDGVSDEHHALPEQKSLTGVIKARIWEIIRAEGTFEEHADAEAAMAIEEIDLSIEIRRRGRAATGPSLLDELAHTLRNDENDVFELETSGGTVRGNELKLTRTKSVKTLNGVPELADVAEKMQECLSQFRDEGQLGEE
jgi:hypothetical protein